MFHRPAALALALSSFMTGGTSQRSLASSTWRLYTPSAGKTCLSMNSATRPQSSFERSDWGGNIQVSLSSSCPTLCRASTSLAGSNKQDVDGRDKPGHDGLGQRRHQAVRFRQHAEVMIGVAERGVDRGHALEVVADLVLHGHAD